MKDPVKSAKSRASRGRGKRGEYLLRNYLRTLGWTAERVPGSGAFNQLPGDVKASKGERVGLLFEVKNWSGKFDRLYALYAANVALNKDDVLPIAMPGAAHLCVAVSTNVESLFDADHYTIDYRHPLYTQHKAAFKRLVTLEKVVKGSEILALKDDRKPFLFLRYI